MEVVVAQHGKCIKCSGITDFKMVDFVLCKFHLN